MPNFHIFGCALDNIIGNGNFEKNWNSVAQVSTNKMFSKE